MEKPELDKNITVVHKGFFYYLFRLIAMPFKILSFCIRFTWKYNLVFFGLLRKYMRYKKKEKQLNKFLSNNPFEEEVI